MPVPEKLKKTYKEVRPNALWDILKWIFQQIKEWGWLTVIGYPATLIWQWLYSIPASFQALLILGIFWTLLGVIAGVIRHLWKTRKHEKALNGRNELSILPEKTKYDFLIERAQKEEKDIASCVRITEIEHVEHILENHHRLYFILALEICNKSLFPITFKSVGGKLLFDGKPFNESPTFSEPPPVIMPREVKQRIRITQELNGREAANLKGAMETHKERLNEILLKRKNHRPLTADIGFTDLILTIKGDGILSAPARTTFRKFPVTRGNVGLNDGLVTLEEIYQKDLKEKVKKLEGERTIIDLHTKKVEEDITKIKKAWDEKRWLMGLADKQAENIARWLSIVEIGNVEQNFEEHHQIKSLVFYLKIRNSSVYDITFEQEITGWLKFRSNALVEKKLFTDLTPPVIRAGQILDVYITQRLDSNEVNLMRDLLARVKSNPKTFHDRLLVILDGLILNIKDTCNAPHFDSKPMEFATMVLDLERF